MKWVWQHSNWPDFTWDRSVLAPFEERFLHESGRRIGAWRQLTHEDQSELRVKWLSGEAVETSAIEGETLDRESVQSSIRRRFGLTASRKTASPEEEGVAEMMVALYHEFDRPLDHETLWRWHRMLMRDRPHLEVVGGYRRHPEAMQVVSGPDYNPKIHYEAPPSERMTEEMERFIEWYDQIASIGSRMSSLAWAGTAHLYFVRIHPFEDGNGRIARALAEKALAQSLGEPSLIALSRTIARRRKGYYAILDESGRSLDITNWLVWFADTVLDAQTWSERRLIRSIQQTRLFDRLHGSLNPRQEKILLRLFDAEPDGFEGGLSAQNYQRITGATASTATRDLANMVAMGALNRTGQRRHTRYWLKLPSFEESDRYKTTGQQTTS
ncbi:MAG: Fic family protein [Candidatus Dadabacteria bacterium]|nr:Fic family protein [Candidatus Dadabacteria bacterium]